VKFRFRNIAFLLLAALTLWQPSVLALTSSDVQSLIEQHPYYDAGGNCSNGDAPVDSTLPATIPDQYAALFNQAAAAFNTSAPLLAAIFLSENSNTWKPFDTKWDTSPSGASGPFQFMPLTWQAYATDGNNDGVKDINNIYDAAYSAAKLLSSYNATPNSPLGSLDRPLKTNTLLQIAASYNAGPGQVQRWGPDAPLSTLFKETREYVSNVYSLITSGFTKSGKPGYPDPVPGPAGGGGGTTGSGQAGCVCAPSTGGNTTAGASTIVIDPGHAGAATAQVDPASGIETKENGGAPGEMQNMWDTAQLMKTKLEAKGYKVVLTKNSEDDPAGFVTKIGRADQANAAIAVSLHYTGGADFGTPNEHYGVTPQEVGRFRENKDNGKRKTFTDAALADKSLRYSQIIAAARSQTGDKTNVAPLDLSFPKDRGDVLAWGDIPIVQLLSKTAWVYNETGSGGFDKQKYATGIADGIMKAVPSTGGGGSTACSGSVMAGNIVQTALSYSWPGPHSPPLEAKPEYLEGVKKYNSSVIGSEADCGVFVGTVMHASGADKNYPASGTTVQAQYVLDNPAKYDVIYKVSDPKELKEGDILIVNEGSYVDASGVYHVGNGAGANGHTYIFVGKQGGQYNEASASLDSRMPSLGTAITQDERGYYMIARLK